MLKSLNGIIEKHLCVILLGLRFRRIGQIGAVSYRKESKERLEDYCTRLKSEGIVAEPHLGAGRTPLEIIRISREIEASMIIMGTTGKDRLHEIFMGSTSHRVAEMSELPTLLVP